jgi:hypothetical protein
MKPGTQVTIGGEIYIAPQMNFGALREMRTLDTTSRSYLDDLSAFVLLKSLSRNYEGVDAMWLNDTLEGSETEAAGKVVMEIMEVSGLKVPERTASGEAPAAA